MGGLAVAHNGNLTNALVLRETLVKDGAIFRTTSDTETIVQLIAKSKRGKFTDKLIDTLFKIQGGYALVLMTNKKLVGVRDPFGIRPLVIGKLKKFLHFCFRNLRIRYCRRNFCKGGGKWRNYYN